MTTPCLDCKERVLGCHSKCKKYNSFKTHINIIRKKERKKYERMLDSGLMSFNKTV